MKTEIHGKIYDIESNEFPLAGKDFPPLYWRSGIAELDKLSSLLNTISTILPLKTIAIQGDCGSGYLPSVIVESYNKIYLNEADISSANLILNIKRHDSHNKIVFQRDFIPEVVLVIGSLLPTRLGDTIPIYCLSNSVILKPDEVEWFTTNRYTLITWTTYTFFINETLWPIFKDHFNKYFENPAGKVLNYDNLVNLLIMVKNAGPSFRTMLEQNLPYIDCWTILDTGSTDNTISIINEVMAGKPGCLYQEPFINFRDSRNRLLELAGKSCVFNIMLDDTYVIKGDIRAFLNTVRADDFADSFSLFMKEIDVSYATTRITRPWKALKYKHTVHEIIESSSSVYVPDSSGYLIDLNNSYMIKRTLDRKEQDLKWLLEEINEFPNDPRQYYYMGETYLVMNKWEEAREWYAKRAYHPAIGYHEERFDSYYKIAVIDDVMLHKDWNICLPEYLTAYEIDPQRPETMYQIGHHYLQKSNNSTSQLESMANTNLAYMYLSHAFDIGAPPSYNCMNIKIDMYNWHLPVALLPLCIKLEQYDKGIKVAHRLNSYKPSEQSNFWVNLFNLVLTNRSLRSSITKDTTTEYIVFVIPGGWKEWYGKTYYESGLGGSESFVIRSAEELVLKGYNVLVYCNYPIAVDWNGVRYIPLIEYIKDVSRLKIKVCFINRYPEYIPITTDNQVGTYLILHDLIRDEDAIGDSIFLKGVLGLTKWHADYITQKFPNISYKVSWLSYGIDTQKFDPSIKKKPYSFIFPSFPNRGLIHLLKMFPAITARYPSATLDVFIDFENEWLNRLFPDLLKEIKELILQQPAITNNGWVNGDTLKKFWNRTEIWFYTADFIETCCLIGFEAAASRTLCITSSIGALSETVGDRGIIIQGSAADEKWQVDAYKVICDVFDKKYKGIDELIEKNYKWAQTKDYKIVTPQFENRFIKNN
jgi:glycosyltransferase involved in cell wall biosynthesis